MNRTRWIQYGVLLAVAFVLSIGAGAFIGGQRTGPPVASVPTPTHAVTRTPTASPLPPTPTAVPTPTPGSVPPSNPPTAPPTPLPTVPPTAAPTLDPPTAEDFARDLLAAIQTADTVYIFDRLHPLVSERYGARQCRRFVNTTFAAGDPDASWTVKSSSGPAPWDWVTDGLTTTVEDTTTVTVEIPDNPERELHFTPFEGTWRWFADCGEPR